MSDSLWGEEFEIPNSLEQTQKILKKIRSPKKQKTNLSVNVEKQLSSSSLSIEERLAIIKTNVYKILGKQKNNVVVIKTKQDFDAYIDKAIQAGIVALDTETNNTLDYLTCKIMGACLYVPNEKQAYVPINHVNYKTGEKLSWQLTEQDVKYEIQRLIDAKVKIIFHNYKFDYQVIKETCGIETPAYWDTIIAIKMIDERDGDETSLKKYYTKHIDRKQKKYDIESLFDAKNIQYAYVDPEIFALYAATDSLMTYKCYLYQLSIFSYPKLAGMYKVFMNIEMPIIKVVADMEIAGIAVDFDYIKRVSAKYHALYDGLTQQVNDEMTKLLPAIEAWKATPEAKEQPKIYATERDLKKKNINERFNYEDKFGKYRLGKSKAEQLDSPISLTSPKQLAILVYDILKLPEGEDYNNPRSTESEILENLAKTHDFKLGKLLSQQKEYYTLLSRYIDKMPEIVSKKDNKIHCTFNPLGAETGRFASDGPNLQNVPSRNKDIRPMFCSDVASEQNVVILDLSSVELDRYSSVTLLNNKTKEVKDLAVGDVVEFMNDNKPKYYKVNSIEFNDSMPYSTLSFTPYVS
jgi:DNA polymerase-1